MSIKLTNAEFLWTYIVASIASSIDPFSCIELGLDLFNKDWLDDGSLVVDKSKNSNHPQSEREGENDKWKS